MNRSLDSIILRYAGYALLFGILAYLLFLVRGTFPIFAVAGLLAYAMEPILKRLENKGYSRGGAVGFVFLIFLLLFILLMVLLATAWQQAQTLASQIPQYQEQVVGMVNAGRDKLDQMHLPKNLKQAILEGIADFQKNAPSAVAEKIQAAVGWTLSSIGVLLLVLVILPIITLWFMLEMNPMRARILMLIPSQYRRDVTSIGMQINELLGRYVRGQMIVCSLFGALCTVTFYTLSFTHGMEYPLVLGVLAALIYIVPYFGMATIATAAGMTAYFTSDAPVLCAVIAVVSCFAFNLTIDYGVSPRVLGKGVGLHPLMVIFALLCGAQIGGVFGMILAIPLFASMRVIAIHLFPQLIAPIPQTSLETSISPNSSKGETTGEIIEQATLAENKANA